MAKSSIRVLLVEDNPTDVLLLREALAEVRLADFELSYVSQLADARDYLNQTAVDVILLDLGLPDSQGLETLLKLRQQTARTPIVVLTGLADEELGLKALQAGAQDYLVKGQVDGWGLARAIRYAIERQRSDEALRESEAKLRILFNLLPVGVSVLDRERNIVEANPAQERILRLAGDGLNQKEYLQRRYLRADGTPMPPEEFPSARALAENRVIEDVEIGIVTAAGDSIWTNVSAAPVGLNNWQVVVTTSDLSWRKWVEESLKQSEAFNRAVLNSLTDHVAVLDREGNVTAVNRAWETFAQTNGEPTLARTGVGLNYLQVCREAAHQNSDAAEALAGIEAVLSGKQDEFYMEYPCHSPDQEYYFLMHISPLSTENGGVVISHLDITQRKQAEAQFQAVVEAAPNAFILVNQAGRITLVNTQAEKLFGYNRQELLGQPVELLIPPPVRTRHQYDRANFLATPTVRQMGKGRDLFGLHKDGSQIPVEIGLSPLVTAAGTFVLASVIDISERKLAEAALRESAEHFRATFDQAFVGMAHAAPGGRWLRVNQKLCEMLGYSREELLQRSFHEITHPDDQAADLEHVNRALAGELQTYTREKRYLHKDGHIVWVNLTVSLVRDRSGEPQYFIAIIQDITARRQAQAEIQRRNRELALLNQVIAASTAMAEPEAFLETVCRELVQAFDLPRVSVVMFEQENTEIVVAAEVVADAGPSALNLRFPVSRNPILGYLLSHEGPLEVADVQRDPHLAPSSEFTRYYGVGSLLVLPLVIDRTIVGSLNLCDAQPRHFSTEEINLAWSVADQVAGALTRAQMVQVQQRLSTAVEQSEQSVIITDTQGNIIYVNPAFERTSGYSQAEALGQNPRLLKSNQHDAAFYAEMWATISAGEVWQGQFINKKKNGTLYTEEASITPVRDENRVIVSYVGLQRDVTRELQLEAQYRQAQKMEAIGRLSGGVAHDFNNLLVVINGYSELLLSRHLDTASPLRKYVEEIMKAGERAAGLTQQLLAFSRKQILQPKALNLNETVAHTEKMLRRLIGEDIDFVTYLEPALGKVKADPGQIEQIILNLGVNARDAMPRGGKLIIETDNVEFDETYISQHAEVKPGHYVMLAVSDTGMGMDAATKMRIFEPFFTTKDQGRGTGLGLATVYGIVKQSGGDIWVYSEVGQGTTFKVYLPRVDEVMPRLGPPERPAAPAGGDETILLVEDELMVRTLARQVLELGGYTVLEAEHGQAALRLAQQHPSIHLLLTDLIMPGGLTGRELAEQLEPLHPETKVLYMSGYTDDAIVHYGVFTSEVHFLQKPFTPLALSAKVRQVLDGG